MSYIDVTAAVIKRNNTFLIARRSAGSHLSGKWEFPGGKVECGETPEACLKRELKEEFHIETEVGNFIGESCFDYESKKIRLLAYYVTHISGDFVLNDHDRLEWVTLEQFNHFDLAPADIPITKLITN